MKKIFLLTFTVIHLWANECSPYYNPQKFYEVPGLLREFIEENISSGTLFEKPKTHFTFIQDKGVYRLQESYMRQGEYLYPTKTGLWQYSMNKGYMDELHISRAEVYRFGSEEIANTINDDFEYFWRDYIEDGYSMQLTPEQTLFRYNDEYFSFSVFIYGVVGDTTPLKGTVVDFWFKNYTNEVNEFIECQKDNSNGS